MNMSINAAPGRPVAAAEQARERIASMLENSSTLAAGGLHVGSVEPTAWGTVLAEVLNAEGGIYMLLEIDPESMQVVRSRRPVPHSGRH